MAEQLFDPTKLVETVRYLLERVRKLEGEDTQRTERLRKFAEPQMDFTNNHWGVSPMMYFPTYITSMNTAGEYMIGQLGVVDEFGVGINAYTIINSDDYVRVIVTGKQPRVTMFNWCFCAFAGITNVTTVTSVGSTEIIGVGEYFALNSNQALFLEGTTAETVTIGNATVISTSYLPLYGDLDGPPTIRPHHNWELPAGVFFTALLKNPLLSEYVMIQADCTPL